MPCALVLAFPNTGSSMLARIAMMAITTSNSISVKPDERPLRGLWVVCIGNIREPIEWCVMEPLHTTSCACKLWFCRICGSDTGERKAEDLQGMEMGILAGLGVRGGDGAGGSNGLRWKGER